MTIVPADNPRGKPNHDWLPESRDGGKRALTKVFAGDQLVACISFGASAWKLQARERFIGWQELERKQYLPHIVNKARFLVLPWIQCKGLASKILALCARRLPTDWFKRYGYSPVLLETFVEIGRASCRERVCVPV